jgi:hypothetical protein
MRIGYLKLKKSMRLPAALIPGFNGFMICKCNVQTANCAYAMAFS